MVSKAATPDDYIAELPPERKEPLERLRKLFFKNLPKGFEERIIYGMIGYVVPHSLYPPGYHCDPKLPLTYIGMASQKNCISLHLSCLYGDSRLYDWFVAEYPKHTKAKLDIGKACVRFKKGADIPYDLIAEVARKMTPHQWIERYEAALAQPRERTGKNAAAG